MNFFDNEALEEFLNNTFSQLSPLSWKKLIEKVTSDTKTIVNKMTQESSFNLEYPFAIDALVYSEQGHLQVEYLELNYRKTMGLLLVTLKRFLKDNSVGKLSITRESLTNDSNVVRLSPEGHPYYLYFTPNWPGT